MEYLEFFMVFQYFYYFFHYLLQKPSWKTLLYELPDDTVQDSSCIVELDMMLHVDAMLCHY